MAKVERPRAIAIIGWIWIVWGAIMALRGGWDFVRNHLTMRAFEASLPPGASPGGGEVWFVQLLAALICLVGIIGCVGAFLLLRMRLRGRLLVELANWGFVIVTALFAYQFQKTAARAAGSSFFFSRREHGLSDLPWDLAQPIVLSTLAILAVTIPFLYMVRKLRSQPVRDALMRVVMREAVSAGADPGAEEDENL
ncbi:MAG: hypothetical protein JRI23_08700 [Deltaproteobacteria bacterium]|jgi:hypothetical protein|nr:hypothetical protein [Deltaproteobacteria bacterium]MBW2531692.1 hypothetical protein [Deltaproteobacteria bacterium]